MKSSSIPSRNGKKTNLAPYDFVPVPTDHEIQGLMDRVAKSDLAAEGELKQLLRPGVAFLIRYSLGDRKPLEAPVEEILSLTVLRVQTQELKDPPELLAFAVQSAKRRNRTSKSAVTMEERTNIGAPNKVSARMPPTERKAVSAYYRQNKTPEEIALEIGISADAFRKLRSSIRLRRKDSQCEIEQLIRRLRDQRQQLTAIIADLNGEESHPASCRNRSRTA